MMLARPLAYRPHRVGREEFRAACLSSSSSYEQLGSLKGPDVMTQQQDGLWMMDTLFKSIKLYLKREHHCALQVLKHCELKVYLSLCLGLSVLER